MLTYLTAHEAQAAIWIVEKPRVEHVNAIAWLNQSSSADFDLVKVEAFKIGDSDPAPLLTLIVGPSEEGKDIPGEKKEFAARHREREAFWEGLLKVANEKTDLHADRSKTKDHFLGAGSGVSGIRFNYVAGEDWARVEVWIARGPGKADENKRIFDQLFQHKDEIERAVGDKLNWRRMDESDSCCIQINTQLGGYRNPEKWPQLYEWMTDKMVALERTFKPYIKSLQL